MCGDEVRKAHHMMALRIYLPIFPTKLHVKISDFHLEYVVACVQMYNIDCVICESGRVIDQPSGVSKRRNCRDSLQLKGH